MSAGTIIENVLDPLTECLTVQAAEKIMAFRADAETQGRVDELAAKSGEGILNEDDRAEYHDLVEAFDLVAIVKSRARSVLAADRP